MFSWFIIVFSCLGFALDGGNTDWSLAAGTARRVTQAEIPFVVRKTSAGWSRPSCTPSYSRGGQDYSIFNARVLGELILHREVPARYCEAFALQINKHIDANPDEKVLKFKAHFEWNDRGEVWLRHILSDGVLATFQYPKPAIQCEFMGKRIDFSEVIAFHNISDEGGAEHVSNFINKQMKTCGTSYYYQKAFCQDSLDGNIKFETNLICPNSTRVSTATQCYAGGLVSDRSPREQKQNVDKAVK